jgi:hypothetical protein
MKERKNKTKNEEGTFLASIALKQMDSQEICSVEERAYRKRSTN